MILTSNTLQLFLQVILPEMCLLRFSVTDDKGDLVGQRVLPLSMIRSGYRFVTLRDKHSQPLLLTSLFIFIKIEDFVPEHWTGNEYIMSHFVCFENHILKFQRFLNLHIHF